MPPKKLNKESEQKPKEDAHSNKPAVSDEEVRQESGKAADAALAAQKKAKELKDAAAAAGDPDERQRLTEEATNAQIEAESFGKTAKYLRSGAFQGAAMGTGLGVAPGATLGAITGTLVGGISSTLLGGLGAGIGGATGALHGPWVNMGKLAGKGMKKMTSFLPQWAASEEQKRALEKMVGQANEEEMPGTEELEKFKSEGGAGEADEGWMKSAKGMLPEQKEVSDAAKAGAQATGGGADATEQSQNDEPSKDPSTQAGDVQGRKKPRKLNAKPKDHDAGAPKTDDAQDTASESSKDNAKPDTQDDGPIDERERKLVERESDLDRREAELEKREKALAKREQEVESKSDGNTSEPTAQKPKSQPRKLASRS
ncbi:hypothetical protein DDE82_003174 [Stemphylium lycopersici]|uniref:Uncharacterized protein n=1 Tax=Stemphylium lycopersici TaxID=183478 RepID=A0A364N3I5_STELY|nr:hypothetical protein TW65_06081 [Stemphylium lycopersici]RAR06638.1 hypothetical protein DDE82_003174 [Stemphylium lycopersici]RAR11019.1 hypothetical protein DDE83_004777 [Stemphylium lycopersici]